MLQLEKSTPFACDVLLFPNAQGVDTLYCAVKATFSLGTGELALAEEQVPIQHGDEFVGEPGSSSLAAANEAHLTKPVTDVAVVGNAQLPDARPCEALVASVRVGALSKQVAVTGDREWTGSTFGKRVGPIERFEKMPLVWERAFGGFFVQDAEKGKIQVEERNPIGRSFRGKRRARDFAGTLLPNLEDPTARISKPGDVQTPSSFGFVPPNWEPRKSYAGTYDDAWQKSRAPFLPLDFDPRFLSAVSADLASPRHLQGGEPVELVNLSPAGPLRFQLPVCDTRVEFTLESQVHAPPLVLETVLFEPDADRCCMTWRTEFACDKKALQVETIRVETLALDVSGRRA